MGSGQLIKWLIGKMLIISDICKLTRIVYLYPKLVLKILSHSQGVTKNHSVSKERSDVDIMLLLD